MLMQANTARSPFRSGSTRKATAARVTKEIAPAQVNGFKWSPIATHKVQRDAGEYGNCRNSQHEGNLIDILRDVRGDAAENYAN